MPKEWIDLFMTDIEKANRKYERVTQANAALNKAKAYATANSKFKTYTQAKTALLAYQRASAREEAYLKSIGGINTPSGLWKLRDNITQREEWERLSKIRYKAEKNLELAKLVFPKLTKKR